MPGRLLHRLAQVTFSARTVEQVLDPLLADFAAEWSAAAGFQRALVRLRGYAAFWTAALWCAAQGVAREFTVPASRAERIVLFQASVWLAFSLALGAALSWVRAGVVTPEALLESLRYTPAIATVPAIVVARFHERARNAGPAATTGMTLITVVLTLSLGLLGASTIHSLGLMAYALILERSAAADLTRPA